MISAKTARSLMPQSKPVTLAFLATAIDNAARHGDSSLGSGDVDYRELPAEVVSDLKKLDYRVEKMNATHWRVYW